jgi:hypothetical protein
MPYIGFFSLPGFQVVLKISFSGMPFTRTIWIPFHAMKPRIATTRSTIDTAAMNTTRRGTSRRSASETSARASVLGRASVSGVIAGSGPRVGLDPTNGYRPDPRPAGMHPLWVQGVTTGA